MSVRQVVVDTETTGLSVELDHRIIEIGCVELKNRRPTDCNMHFYVNPDRAIDRGAQDVHGISSADLADKPRFAEIGKTLWEYLADAELIIHNAAFDLGFLNAEFARMGIGGPLEQHCTVTDTLALARKLHPGQKVNLDALCRRYGVDNSGREFHGALLDARLLADVFLAMTGGQSMLGLDATSLAGTLSFSVDSDDQHLPSLIVLRASPSELDAHRARLAVIAKKSGQSLWVGE